MGQDILFSNKKKVDTLKKYIYNNRLKEEEIDKVLTSFAESFYTAGLEHGEIICKNVAKRIKSAEKKCRDKSFDRVYSIIEDDLCNHILSKKKTK
jgi:hypothetical protein